MHKLLGRQVRRKASIASEEAFAKAVRDIETLAATGGLSSEAAQLAAGLSALIVEIDKSYEQFDRDIELRRRSLEISSKELLDVNERLRADAASRGRAYDSLLDAANRLLAEANLPVIARGDADISACPNAWQPWCASARRHSAKSSAARSACCSRCPPPAT
ncbi:MAG: hypothetical protein FJY56_04400 [Betaproteobacteria bacterium]|nr:hypothetical protein [Betaproteobacteria bacterium]